MKQCTARHASADAANLIDAVTAEISASYQDGIGINHNEGHNLPRETEVLSILSKLLELIFPGFAEREAYSMETLKFSVGEIVSSLYIELNDVIHRACKYHCMLTETCDECKCQERALSAALRR